MACSKLLSIGAIDASPEMIVGLMQEIGQDIEAVLDVEEAVITLLNEDKKVNDVFQKCGDRNLSLLSDQAHI